jgi:hypothetical protein
VTPVGGLEPNVRSVSYQRQRIRSVSGAALERRLVALHRVMQPDGASGHARPPSTPSERGVASFVSTAVGCSPGDPCSHATEDRSVRVIAV